MGLESVKELQIDTSTSLVAQGINSSAAVLIRNALADSLSTSFPITLVYDHHTIDSIAVHIVSVLDGSYKGNLIQQVQDEIKRLQSEIDLSKSQSSVLPTPSSIKHILLTGATGFVGCHLLENLLNSTQATIHCIVRATNDQKAHERVVNKMKEQHCLPADAYNRIIAHAGDLSASNLGLTSLSFMDSIDAIYHAGAVVNWILPYSQMKENVTGGTELIKVMAARGKKVPFHLISTIAASGVEMAIKEGGQSSLQGFGGYPLSKWASEQITLYARSQGLPVTIFRFIFFLFMLMIYCIYA